MSHPLAQSSSSSSSSPTDVIERLIRSLRHDLTSDSNLFTRSFRLLLICSTDADLIKVRNWISKFDWRYECVSFVIFETDARSDLPATWVHFDKTLIRLFRPPGSVLPCVDLNDPRAPQPFIYESYWELQMIERQARSGLIVPSPQLQQQQQQQGWSSLPPIRPGSIPVINIDSDASDQRHIPTPQPTSDAAMASFLRGHMGGLFNMIDEVQAENEQKHPNSSMPMRTVRRGNRYNPMSSAQTFPGLQLIVQSPEPKEIKESSPMRKLMKSWSDVPRDVRKDKPADSEKTMCKICYVNESIVTIAPCWHKCVCVGCMDTYLKRQKKNNPRTLPTCLVCRKPMESVGVAILC
jgi:hypothetical protein